MATNEAEILPRPITPQFQDSAPILDGILPPLTPEEQKEVDKLMTETPKYQRIQENCRTIKADALRAAATATELLKAIQDKTLPEENLEATIEVIKAAAASALEGRAVLEELSKNLEEAGLPAGDCQVGNSSITASPQGIKR